MPLYMSSLMDLQTKVDMIGCLVQVKTCISTRDRSEIARMGRREYRQIQPDRRNKVCRHEASESCIGLVLHWRMFNIPDSREGPWRSDPKKKTIRPSASGVSGMTISPDLTNISSPVLLCTDYCQISLMDVESTQRTWSYCHSPGLNLKLAATNIQIR